MSVIIGLACDKCMNERTGEININLDGVSPLYIKTMADAWRWIIDDHGKVYCCEACKEKAKQERERRT